MSDEIDKYFSGEKLYGDDFELDEIQKWYQDEEEAYYDFAHAIPEYEYHVFNEYYAYSKFGDRQFKACLAFGCANGDDVSIIANNVASFIALEPAEKWWSNNIGGKSAEYIKPRVDGNIPLPESSVDLAVCLGVLHHIPNVSFVISELSRVLENNGLLILREPVFSMGDWRKRRKGLTSRERGIPPDILLRILTDNEFEVLSAKPCMVPTTPRIARFFGVTNAYNSLVMVAIDRISSSLLKWNMRYHRRNVLEKLAPTSLFVLAKKTDNSAG